MMVFRDRTDAGRRLAGRLTEYADRRDVLVLALPRAGVPVAFEVAEKLDALAAHLERQSEGAAKVVWEHNSHLGDARRCLEGERGDVSVEESKRGNICDTPTDPSLEFDTFEYMRSKLTDAFIEAGHTPLEAAKIALYVVQGVRNVPKLLRVFTVEKPPTPDELSAALGPVLDEAPALEKARRLLLHLDQEDQP